MKRIAITGAAGNLGGLLAHGLKDREVSLNLLTHNKDVDGDLKNRGNISVYKTDLAKEDTLNIPLKGVDTVVHFAGVLFKANPEKFLPTTNTQ